MALSEGQAGHVRRVKTIRAVGRHPQNQRPDQSIDLQAIWGEEEKGQDKWLPANRKHRVTHQGNLKCRISLPTLLAHQGNHTVSRRSYPADWFSGEAYGE